MDQVNSSGPAEIASLKLAMRATDNYGDGVSAYAVVTDELLTEIFRLRTICRRYDLREAAVIWGVEPYDAAFDPEDLGSGDVCLTADGLPELDVDDDDYWRVAISYLVVSGSGDASFRISVKHGGEYDAAGISLDTIREALQDFRAD